MTAPDRSDDVVRVDFGFRRELAEKVEGNLASFCYQCGACVGDCPTARFSEDFNPRNIMLNVLYGMREEVVGTVSPVWQCSNCFTCFDRCPQDVKPIEVIIALKNLMAREGITPKGVDRLVEGLLKTGRSALVTSATHRRREELGLPPLGEIDPAELLELLDEPPPADKAAAKSAATPEGAAAKKGQKNSGKGGKK